MSKIKLFFFSTIVLFVSSLSAVNTTEAFIDEPFSSTIPSEISRESLQEPLVESPSLRWAPPEEDGDGDDQKLVPVGDPTLITTLGLFLICLLYVFVRHSKNSNVNV